MVILRPALRCNGIEYLLYDPWSHYPWVGSSKRPIWSRCETRPRSWARPSER